MADYLSMLATTIATESGGLMPQPTTGGRGSAPGLTAMQAHNMPMRGVAQTGMPPSGGMPSGMGGNFNSLEAQMAYKDAQGRSGRTFGGSRSKQRGMKLALTKEEEFRAEALQKQKQQGMERADAVYTVMKPHVGDKAARQMAQQAFTDPDIAKEVMKQYAGQAASTSNIRDLKHLNSLPEGELKETFKEMLLGKDKGLAFGFNPDTNMFMLSQDGGSVEMPVSAASNSTQKNIVFKNQGDLSESLRSMHSVRKDFDEDFLRPIGKLQGEIGRFADSWDIPDEFVDKVTGRKNVKRWGAKLSNFAKKAYRRVLVHRKAMTGVAGGEKEMAAIESSLANAMEDNPLTFMYALESEVQDTYHKYNLQQILDGKPEYDFSGKEYQLFPELYDEEEEDLDPMTGQARPAIKAFPDS